MIISLDDLKAALGLTDDSEDAHLTTLITNATQWVEGETHRRFDVPIPRIQYRKGTGNDTMWLDGHADSTDATHPEYGAITVEERVWFGDWTAIDPTAFEIRYDPSLTALARIDGYPWVLTYDYRITYVDGYVIAPGDIQMLISALVVAQYRLDVATADGSAGITSETLVGVYSYVQDRRRATLESDGSLSELSTRTLNRYRRHLI